MVATEARKIIFEDVLGFEQLDLANLTIGLDSMGWKSHHLLSSSLNTRSTLKTIELKLSLLLACNTIYQYISISKLLKNNSMQ